MGIPAVSILVGMLMLGATQVAIGQSNPSGGQSQSTAGGSPAADRDSFTQKVHAKMVEWELKMQRFTEKSVAAGQKATTATANGLTKAWDKTQEAARNVQSATTKTWDKARDGFDKASRELSDAWDKVPPENK
jgi:hypothetical protein